MSIKDFRISRHEAAMAEAKKYTAAEMARHMGVSVPTFRKWEESDEPEKVLTMDQAKRLADYFGCSVDSIFYLPHNHK